MYRTTEEIDLEVARLAREALAIIHARMASGQLGEAFADCDLIPQADYQAVA